MVVRMPLPIVNHVAAELLHHLLERTGHVPVGVGLRLQTEVGRVFPTGRVRRVGDRLRGNQSSTCASIVFLSILGRVYPSEIVSKFELKASVPR